MVTLTPAAREHVLRFLAKTPEAAGLRFGVERTGCSGWGYVVDVARDVGQGDTVFEHEGIRVLVDAASLDKVDGTEIDFVRQGLNHQFVFSNPRATAACGCGESFTTDAEVA